MKGELPILLAGIAALAWCLVPGPTRETPDVYPGAWREAYSESDDWYRSNDSYYKVVTYFRKTLSEEWHEMHTPLLERLSRGSSGVLFGKNLVLRDGRYEVVNDSRSGWLLTVSPTRVDGRSVISFHRYLGADEPTPCQRTGAGVLDEEPPRWSVDTYH